MTDSFNVDISDFTDIRSNASSLTPMDSPESRFCFSVSQSRVLSRSEREKAQIVSASRWIAVRSVQYCIFWKWFSTRHIPLRIRSSLLKTGRKIRASKDPINIRRKRSRTKRRIHLPKSIYSKQEKCPWECVCNQLILNAITEIVNSLNDVAPVYEKPM
jgi:hypothetical protein